MKIAVIGANSFLAQYIIEEINSKRNSLYLYGLTPIERFKEHDFYRFSFPDSRLDFHKLLNYDAIIYTAGAGIQANLNESFEIIYELNVYTPIRIANFLSENNFAGKLVTFGSYFEIGNEPEKKYYTEDDLALAGRNVPNHYCASKRLLTRYFQSAPISVNFYHFVLPNIYGKGENPNRLIPYLINTLESNGEIKLTNGKQIRQYLHTKDVGLAVLDALEKNYPSGIYNLTNQESYSVREVVLLVFKFAGRQAQFNESIFGKNERTDTQMPYLLLNNQKAMSVFSLQPKISIEEGIKSYYE